jgi:hypothetical protein
LKKKASKVQSKTYGSTHLDLSSTKTTFFSFFFLVGEYKKDKGGLENMEFL